MICFMVKVINKYYYVFIAKCISDDFLSKRDYVLCTTNSLDKLSFDLIVFDVNKYIIITIN